jgi:DNA-binding response OmpR family regulator
MSDRPRLKTILLVDDEPALRELVRRMLESCGFHVLSAATPAEGIRLACTHIGPIALVLTDVNLPGMTGQALGEQLAKIRPESKTLFMSGHSESVTDQSCSQHDLMLKPFTLDALRARISKLLE